MREKKNLTVWESEIGASNDVEKECEIDREAEKVERERIEAENDLERKRK